MDIDEFSKRLVKIQRLNWWSAFLSGLVVGINLGVAIVIACYLIVGMP